VFSHSSWVNHDSIHYFRDDVTGLKAIVGIHDTLLGPALGGCRLYNYKNETEALNDVLRLSRGMTFKAACAGLPLGGGKSVVIGPPPADPDERGGFFRRFGMFIDSLGGNYVAAEDIGVSVSDMVHIRAMTEWVAGIPTEMGGSGNPAPYTAHGVYLGMKQAVLHKHDTDSLSGMRILVEGLGSVGYLLAKKLHNEGAELIVCDVNELKVQKALDKFGCKSVPLDYRFDEKFDIYSPNALGGTITAEMIPKLSCSIVAGAANNQLVDDQMANLLMERDILYVPDFVLNAGGLINVSLEKDPDGWSEDRAVRKLSGIATNLEDIFTQSARRQISTLDSAIRLAVHRLSRTAYRRGCKKDFW